MRHSHAYTLASAFRRFFDSGASADRAYLAGERDSERVLRAAALRYARGETRLACCAAARRAGSPTPSLYELAKMAGLVLGARHERLPLSLKRRMSAMPGHWDRPPRRRAVACRAP